MSESIGSRVKRLISGSINAAIDAAENTSPLIVMQESIREIEKVIAEIRAEMGKEAVQKHRLEEKLSAQESKHKTLSDHISVALSESREDLAEAAIAKQMDIEAQIPLLQTSLKESNQTIEKLESYIIALQAKKREMQEELQRVKKASESVGLAQEESQNVSKAEEAFHRVMREKSLPTTPSDEAKLAELEELARKNRIKERLEALKASHS